MISRNIHWSAWLALTTVLVGGVWHGKDYLMPLFGLSTEEPPAPVTEVAPVKRGPRYPVAAPAPPDPAGSELDSEVEPLPALDESDVYARTRLNEIFGATIDTELADGDLVYKFVATIDNLTQAQPPRKTWPITTRLKSFEVAPASVGSNDTFYPRPENYQRYDFLVDLATGAEPETMAAAYRQIYPLLQETFVGLGYPDGYFNDRLVEVIDHLLLTPEPVEPVLLVRPHVLYQYADPALESLSGGQKQLLRMGNANSVKIKTSLRAFRQLIVQPADMSLAEEQDEAAPGLMSDLPADNGAK